MSGDAMKRAFFILSFFAALLMIFQDAATKKTIATSSTEEVANGKYVALTFDDGPRRDTTLPLLDGLRKRGAKATFFVIGEQIPGNEDILWTMAADGHQIGNHTFSHCCLKDATDSAIIEEIHKTEVLLTETLGENSYWLRPPYGLIDTRCSTLVTTPMLYWSVDPEDWKNLDASKVATSVLSEVESGDIVLLHDFYPTSVEAALQIVDALRQEGYTFVTVSELFDLFGTVPEIGTLYADASHQRSW